MKSMAKVRTALGDYWAFRCDCELGQNEYLAVRSFNSPSELHPKPIVTHFAIDYIWEARIEEVNVKES